MAKRFTDTQKYRKPFFRGLSAIHKLFWDYLYHECDHAGIWIVDFDIARICVGSTKKEEVSEKTIQVFNEDEIRVIPLDGGKKWFIPSFVEFQYGTLNPKNKAHSSVIKILSSLGINPTTLKLNSEFPRTPEECFKPEPKEVKAKKFSDLPTDSLLAVENISEVYLKDEKLLKAVSGTTKKSVDQIKSLMPVFLNNLQSQGKAMESPREFAKYFKNWLPYQDDVTAPEDKLDWSLLTKQERFTLEYSQQVELIRERSANG